jgi:outer membrane autotransporter protein
LDRIREVETDVLTPPAAGSGDELNRFWFGGFGVFADQTARDNVLGYDFKAAGIAFGYDRKVYAVPGLRLGISGNISRGDWDNDDGRTEADVDSVGLGVYGSYAFQNGFFVDASLAWNRSDFDVTTRLVTGGTAKGSFDVDTWQVGARAGGVLKSGGFQFIPSVGVRFISFKQDGYVESLDAAAVASGATAHVYGSKRDSKVDIPVQLKINTSIEAGSATITPELRLGATFTAKRPDNDLSVGFVGSGLRARIVGVRAPSTTFQAGAGVKINTGGPLDVFVNYDLDAGRGFTSHNASIGLGVEF